MIKELHKQPEVLSLEWALGEPTPYAGTDSDSEDFSKRKKKKGRGSDDEEYTGGKPSAKSSMLAPTSTLSTRSFKPQTIVLSDGEEAPPKRGAIFQQFSSSFCRCLCGGRACASSVTTTGGQGGRQPQAAPRPGDHG